MSMTDMWWRWIKKKSGSVEGCRRWRGSILVTQRNHDIHLLCSLPNTVVIWMGVNKVPPNFIHCLRHLYMSFSIKGLTGWYFSLDTLAFADT
jgi:hypothetical protein